MGGRDAAFSMACGEIVRGLLAAGRPTGRRVREEIKRACAKYSLDRIPGNREILSAASGPEFARLRRVLVTRPVKTASGVAVVALMPKPYACPHGRCTYCPGGAESNSPNSYTGNEPSTVSAMGHGYDPGLQIAEKIERLVALGHDPGKMELVIVGGTFLFMPADYREGFIKSCYDALNGTVSRDLREAKGLNERARIRNVGLTVETKPDFCKKEHVDTMLGYGVTRVEVGVQSLRERVYRIVNRGHGYGDVVEAFQVSKDAGYKVAAHMMPGLPTMTPGEDVADFERLFADADLKPDMLKIYPALVLGGTRLARDHAEGRYSAYSDDEMIEVLTSVKKKVPRWVRIMRIQREISPGEIIAGPRAGNLRQLVRRNLERQGLACRCIRCREIGLSGRGAAEPRLRRTDYESSGGDEVFLSFEDSADSIYGYLRLRRPSAMAHRREVRGGACIVRELHVLGRSLGIGQKGGAVQHAGLGKRLMLEAERISREEFDAGRLLVISAVGTREYYRGMGYSLYGPYMSKTLD